MREAEGFTEAGLVVAVALNLQGQPLPPDRQRHAYGNGPFAKLRMLTLPSAPGVYLWVQDERVVYVGQTRMPLKTGLGSQGYSTISNYNTFVCQGGPKPTGHLYREGILTTDVTTRFEVPAT
jgi:hypothetical protein